MGIAVLGGGPPHYCYYDYAVDLRRHRRHRSWLPRQPGAVPHGPGHAGPGPGRVPPPSPFLAATAAGQGATRDRAVIGSGPGRVHCVLLPPSRAGGPAPVRPRAHGCHLGRSLAHWILSGASLRREPAPVAGCSRVSRPGQGSRVWTARGTISVRGRSTPGSRPSPGTLAGALDHLRRFAPSGTGASRRELTGVASGPGPSCVDRQGRHLSQGPRLWTGPCSGLIWAGVGAPDRQRVPCSASSWSAVRPPLLSQPCNAAGPGPAQSAGLAAAGRGPFKLGRPPGRPVAATRLSSIPQVGD